METEKDFKRADAFQTEWQHNQEEAHGECIDKAMLITLSVEHLITESTSSVEQRNITELFTAVQKIVNLRFYDFDGTVEGKYQVYDETFEYDFSEALMGLLEDTLGYNYKELFV